jgi:hypothetical protein
MPVLWQNIDEILENQVTALFVVEAVLTEHGITGLAWNFAVCFLKILYSAV